MEAFLFYLALVNLLVVLFCSWLLLFGDRSVVRLKDVPLPDETNLAKVSVIVAARNEECDIENALQSLLSQDYEDLEVIVVDDRSTDRTGEILDRMAEGNERLKVVHLTELPKGWLGKNHAMDYGAEQATGDWVLFTDADVVMEADTIRRAVGYSKSNGLDHLTIMPEMRLSGWFLQSVVFAFYVYLMLLLQPWKAKNPKSRFFIGIGAFNLVRADVYRAIGTHKAIAMRPDDDVMLGRLIKRCGYRQEAVFGKGNIHVPWYSSVGELAGNFTKNQFAGVNYHVSAVIAVTVPMLLFDVWPFIGLFVTEGMTQLLYATVVAILLLRNRVLANNVGINKNSTFGFGAAAAVYVYIFWRATILTFVNDGINWRDTHYSLEELKANKGTIYPRERKKMQKGEAN